MRKKLYHESASREKPHNNTAMASMSILVACLMRPWKENGGGEYSTTAVSSS
jgi:hypothetical protein